MNKCLIMLIFIMFFSNVVFSQNVKKGYRYTPEELAKIKIDEMNPVLDLTEDQQNYIYDLYVKYIKDKREDEITYRYYNNDIKKIIRKERLKEFKNSLKRVLTPEQVHKFINFAKSKFK